MKKELNRNNLFQQIGFGLTTAALVLSCCVCVCAVTGQGLISILLCSVACIFSSVRLKNGIFIPDVFLLVPVFYIFAVSSRACASFSVLVGACIFVAIKKLIKSITIPSCIIAGVSLSLSIGVTILLTNYYFGIGATGETPFEMLKAFRYLGFHPNFRGLLYGTITLFTMITFPFKFRKLNKYLPAQFITILIPFVLNLFLNPEKDLTTINEADFTPLFTSLQNIPSFFKGISSGEISEIIKNATALGLIFTGYSLTTESKEDKELFLANAFSGVFSGIPLKKHYLRGYGKASALTAITIITASVILFPSFFSRLPVHSAGSMLIVFAWQSMPYKALSEVFKSKKPLNIVFFALCIPVFILFKPFIATILCVILTLFFNQTTTSSVRKECAI